jgi:hypothetical protein
LFLYGSLGKIPGRHSCGLHASAAPRCVGAAAIYLVLRLVGFHKLFENDAEGIGALLQIIGTLYSVVYAFAIYVIWGQFTTVETEILKESGALKDLLVFSQQPKETVREPVVRAVKIYARGVAENGMESAVSRRGDRQDRQTIYRRHFQRYGCET